MTFAFSRFNVVCIAVSIGLVACGEPDASSSSHWLVCSKDPDCANFPGATMCGGDGFCEGADGHKVTQALVFEDTFDQGPLNSQNFAYETGFSIRNNDAEDYTARPSNVFIDNGELVLEANAETLDQAQYTSGSIDTQGLKSFTYGRIAARILVPDGAGVGPAFWMLPEAPGDPVTVCDDTGKCVSAEWPAWGDIVIMTIRSETPNQVLHTSSYATWDGATMQYLRGQGGGTQTLPESAGAAYHEYAVEWGPERIDWLTDGVVQHSFDTTAPDIYQPSGQDPFSKPFNIRLSLAVGGLSEAPDPSVYPQQMRVDWLRVWQYQ
jgi:beta-glucanase (GH16 family)